MLVTPPIIIAHVSSRLSHVEIILIYLLTFWQAVICGQRWPQAGPSEREHEKQRFAVCCCVLGGGGWKTDGE